MAQNHSKDYSQFSAIGRFISPIMPRLLLFLVLLLVSALSIQAADRPNVLFLFSDDQRVDTIASLGNAHIRTPNLDRLVKSGTAFTGAYCMGANQGAVCVPSRAM